MGVKTKGGWWVDWSCHCLPPALLLVLACLTDCRSSPADEAEYKEVFSAAIFEELNIEILYALCVPCLSPCLSVCLGGRVCGRQTR